LTQIAGANLFAPNVCHEIRQAVLHSDAVKLAIDQAVASKPNLNVQQVKAQVIQILTEMNAEPQEQIMRGMTYSVQKILKRLYRHVTILDSQIEQVRETSTTANFRIRLHSRLFHSNHFLYLHSLKTFGL
jgi:hypothetical protein